MPAVPLPAPVGEAAAPRAGQLLPAVAPKPPSRKGPDETQGSPFSRRDVPESTFGSFGLRGASPEPKADEIPNLPGDFIRLGSKVHVEMVANGKKLAFTLVLTGSDLEDGELGIHTPMAQALLDAREGEEVEYQRGVELVDVRIISVMNG